MKNSRSLRNERIRTQLIGVVASYNPGDVLLSADIAKRMSTRARSVNPRNIGKNLAMIDSVRWKRDGVWIKI